MYRLVILICCVASVWTFSLKDAPTIVPFQNLGKTLDGPRIINGDKASKGQFPWQAAIFVSLPGQTNLCGGALINEKWVLTAGHCVQDATNFRIALGSTLLTGTDSDRVVVETSEFVLHENYSQFNLANDIALIPLPTSVSFNDYIKPIDLESSNLNANTAVTVSGWGLTSDGGDGASNDLNYVGLVTISDSDCSAAYNIQINDGVLCAQGNGDIAQSTCEGDSGGPLVINPSNDPIHVGIVSFGHRDGCESGKPVGFSSTAYFRNWIREKSGV